MEFKPLHDRIAVRRLEQKDKTPGGIIIPDTAQEKPSEGVVVSVGSGVSGKDGKIVPLDIQSGDKVLFGKWSGTEIKIDGDNC
jgi:chaperonin GroES